MLRGNYVNKKREMLPVFIYILPPNVLPLLKKCDFGQAVHMFVSLLFEFDTDVG